MSQGLVAGQIHGLPRDRVPQAAPAVEQGAGRRLANQARSSLQIERASAPLLFVHGQHRDTMRVHTQAVRLRHQGRAACRQVLRHSPGDQHTLYLLTDQGHPGTLA
ncbi:hypothetical protein J3Q30_15295 [Bordetella holmesii]|nr:hypothetical protein H558_12110 [Bordetella holmesii H558]AMD50530.1 hypothetical protein F783_005950 [Bordetella holmesii F627]MBO1241639.1 hypothetical protein [Bordetella holmesii]MBO1244026.1 hypothetical protein [Bordetella holmesii]MBO1253798.1 hypothetical protein [Bordetella holmesii]